MNKSVDEGTTRPLVSVSWSSTVQSCCASLWATPSTTLSAELLFQPLLCSGWRSWAMRNWWVHGSLDTRGVRLVRFQNSLSIFSAHNICIGFSPCPPNHHLIPHQTTHTNAGSHSFNSQKPPSSCKAKGKQRRKAEHLDQFLLGIQPKFLLFPPDW